MHMIHHISPHVQSADNYNCVRNRNINWCPSIAHCKPIARSRQKTRGNHINDKIIKLIPYSNVWWICMSVVDIKIGGKLRKSSYKKVHWTVYILWCDSPLKSLGHRFEARPTVQYKNPYTCPYTVLYWGGWM